MAQICQTRPHEGRAGRDQLRRSSLPAPTLSEFRTQLIAPRFRLSLSMAREVCRCAFGEVCND